MSSQEEPSELAKRAGRQGKNAIRNAGRAARAATQPVLEEVQETVEDVTGEAAKTAKRIDPSILSRLSGDTVKASIAMSVSLYAGIFAVNKFYEIYTGRSSVIKSMPKMPHIPDVPAA